MFLIRFHPFFGLEYVLCVSHGCMDRVGILSLYADARILEQYGGPKFGRGLPCLAIYASSSRVASFVQMCLWNDNKDRSSILNKNSGPSPSFSCSQFLCSPITHRPPRTQNPVQLLDPRSSPPITPVPLQLRDLQCQKSQRSAK